MCTIIWIRKNSFGIGSTVVRDVNCVDENVEKLLSTNEFSILYCPKAMNNVYTNEIIKNSKNNPPKQITFWYSFHAFL